MYSYAQGCYGIVHAPSGLWFCRKCESQERAARVVSDVCVHTCALQIHISDSLNVYKTVSCIVYIGLIPTTQIILRFQYNMHSTENNLSVVQGGSNGLNQPELMRSYGVGLVPSVKQWFDPVQSVLGVGLGPRLNNCLCDASSLQPPHRAWHHWTTREFFSRKQ